MPPFSWMTAARASVIRLGAPDEVVVTEGLRVKRVPHAYEDGRVDEFGPRSDEADQLAQDRDELVVGDVELGQVIQNAQLLGADNIHEHQIFKERIDGLGSLWKLLL